MRGTVTPPAPPPPNVSELEQIDPVAAASATQPAHRPAKPRDRTVDPLVLGPQARPKPPPAKEVAVVCYLCRTRMYAPLSKIGETMKCPDCHTVNEIKGPKQPPVKKPSGPPLDESSDFQLDEPADRPAYRPMIAARGEYSALAEFDPAQRPAGWSRPNDVQMTNSAPQGKPKPYEDDDDDDNVELTVAAPVERLEIKTELKPLPPPDPDDDLYDGRYDDGLIGDNVDRKAANAWKKAPFVIGILGFLFYGNTLARLFFYSLGLAVCLNLGNAAVRYGMSDDPSSQVLAIFLGGMASVSLGFFVVSFAAVLLALAQDTANGQDDVTGWPDWNVFDWIATAIYFPAAAFVAVLPGALFGTLLSSVIGNPMAAAFAIGGPLVLSWMALFPLVLYSMLAEGTITAPFSPHTYRSLQVATAGWVYFYMYSMVFALLGLLAGALTGAQNWFVNSLGAIGLIALALLYCRVLGRLMWYASERMLEAERRGEG